VLASKNWSQKVSSSLKSLFFTVRDLSACKSRPKEQAERAGRKSRPKEQAERAGRKSRPKEQAERAHTSKPNFSSMAAQGRAPPSPPFYIQASHYLATHDNLRNILTGVCVGLSDIALCYPLAVLATRCECGLSFRMALRQGNYWSGGWTCGTLLVPYSACVEGGSKFAKQQLESELAATAAISVVATLGMQIIEKKLTMDQMLQQRGK
jgi:hypothetical protein